MNLPDNWDQLEASYKDGDDDDKCPNCNSVLEDDSDRLYCQYPCDEHYCIWCAEDRHGSHKYGNCKIRRGNEIDIPF